MKNYDPFPKTPNNKKTHTIHFYSASFTVNFLLQLRERRSQHVSQVRRVRVQQAIDAKNQQNSMENTAVRALHHMIAAATARHKDTSNTMTEPTRGPLHTSTACNREDHILAGCSLHGNAVITNTSKADTRQAKTGRGKDTHEQYNSAQQRYRYAYDSAQKHKRHAEGKSARRNTQSGVSGTQTRATHLPSREDYDRVHETAQGETFAHIHTDFVFYQAPGGIYKADIEINTQREKYIYRYIYMPAISWRA